MQSGEGRAHDGRRGPVDRPGADRIDGAAAPEPAQLAVGLQRPGSAAALEAGLDGLDAPGEEWREGETRQLDAEADRIAAAHPSAPRRASASRRTTRPTK